MRDMRTDERCGTNESKVKSLAHLFKGGGGQGGGASLSSSAEGEIRLQAVKTIKTLADKYKSPKSRLHFEFKNKQNVRFISDELKSISCRRLETESNFCEIAFQFPPLGAGTDISAFHFYKVRTMQRKLRQVGSINQLFASPIFNCP